MDKLQDDPDWRVYFDDRQLALIENCRKYAHDNPAGLPGHQLMLIISRMSDLLEAADLRLPVEIQINWKKR